MAGIEKPITPTRVVPGTVPSDAGAPPPPAAGGSPAASAPLPDLNRFAAITGRSPGAPRSILTRTSVGYNGPHEIGGVRFASTDAALDQIIVENGADGNRALLQRAYDEVMA